jgi:putative intracellular protease/amidase
MPIPSRDFDPTEVAISWEVLAGAGHRVSFATPLGQVAAADPLMLTGEGLDLWGFIPGLRKFKLLGLVLRANADARNAYRELVAGGSFQTPLSYAALRAQDFDALLLPGGHWSRGMREYLESPVLQQFVGDFADAGKPFAAICHGTVLVARSLSRSTGKSVLYGRKTTGLTWRLERSAWNTMKRFGRVWHPDYYRTYLESENEPAGFRSVQAEVERALRDRTDFLDVTRDSPDYFRKTSGFFRDSRHDSRPAFVVVDGRYVSARWPGDAHQFALNFAQLL